jgi:hypothetical protein
LLNIYIDADGCAVKEEVYKVALRYKLKVFIVANKQLSIPDNIDFKMQVVSGGFDAADDWIVENAVENDILITSDLLLADRCIKTKVRVLGPKGRELNEENIGDVLGTRELMSHLRNLGDTKTGPSAMLKTDRSNFLSKLDQVIQSILKKR